MEKFIILNDSSTIGFQEHVSINLFSPVESQLQRRQLIMRKSTDKGRPEEIKKIIEKNASLRVDFGWSFESSFHYEKIMKECLEKIVPNFHVGTNNMISDLRCNWIGFIPYNVFEKDIYEDLSLQGLILFNNELVDYQIAVIKFITEHEIFKQHSIIRSDRYRFALLKSIRKNPDALADVYHYYMRAVHDICAITSLPRDILEEQIGCHYLHYPDLFFELLEFSILKGEIHG